MTVQDLYDYVKSFGSQDCEIKIVMPTEAKPVEIGELNISVYFDEVLLVP